MIDVVPDGGDAVAFDGLDERVGEIIGMSDDQAIGPSLAQEAGQFFFPHVILRENRRGKMEVPFL